MANGNLDDDPEAALVKAIMAREVGAEPHISQTQVVPTMLLGANGQDEGGLSSRAMHGLRACHAPDPERNMRPATAAGRPETRASVSVRRRLLQDPQDGHLGGLVPAAGQDEDSEAALVHAIARDWRSARAQRTLPHLPPEMPNAALPNLRQFDVDYHNFRVVPNEEVLRKVLGAKPLLAGLRSEAGLERLRGGAAADPSKPATGIEAEEEEDEYNADDAGTEILLVRSPVFLYVRQCYGDAVFHALRKERASVRLPQAPPVFPPKLSLLVHNLAVHVLICRFFDAA
jgi:hypothetical protein